MTQKGLYSKPTKGQSRYRKRRCLLKGCEKTFIPTHPLKRYCCKECRQLAKKWQEIRAREKYRRSIKGKEARRLQNIKYRKNRKEKLKKCRLKELKNFSEGDPKEKNQGVICCRAGCYQRIVPSRRSPLKKYCSKACRRAVRTVMERERRWKKVLKRISFFQS